MAKIMPHVRHCCRTYPDVNEPCAHCHCASDERLIFYIIIPHVNFPYKTSIDEGLIFFNITRCYRDGEYCHSFAIAAGDIVKLRTDPEAGTGGPDPPPPS